ncbi:putative metalloprotease [Micromonospora pisi]|uniref:Putative metalloprotease n=1 Tax=Micromonospora pisi TaxID=589240 RepID=A0A495JE32_9ACTN|nr:neutral zinc metallopeptidase [Micromonospora pisi]RKR86329.1 putative metalloprotease [Micromonospora pisi]
MTRSAHRIRWGAVLLAVTLLAGCTRSVAGTGGVERWSSTKVAGLEITTGESGPRPGAGDSRLTAFGGDRGAIDQLALNAIDDVQRYWSEQLPASFGKRFEPVGQLISYDSGGAGVQVCQASTAGLVNAFYCAADDTVAWDRGELLPTLNDSFGPMSVVAVLAHELGHAVQFRLGAASGITAQTSSIVKEQQADCYAGNFFRWVAEGNAPHFQISTGPGLNQILSTLFFIRDSAGTGFDAEGAHGNAFDRVSAFQFGFGDGPVRCARINEAEVRDRITQQASGDQEAVDGDEGNLRVDDRSALTALQTTLRAVFVSNGPRPPSIVVGAPDCPDARRTSPASYCPSSDTIGLDLDDLVRIGTAPQRGNRGGIGDFAAFAEVASRYALSLQRSAGYPLRGLATAQRTACLTGVWAGAIVAGRGAALQLSPGDLDEAVAEMLTTDSVIAADVDGGSVPSGFARVEAFRAGFSATGSTTDAAATCVGRYQ